MKIEQLLNLKVGTKLGFQGKNWTVKEVYQYNWDGESTIEFKIKSKEEEAYLEIEEDDDFYTINFSVDISAEDIDPMITIDDLEAEEVLAELFYSATNYFLEEIDEGEFVDLSGLDTPMGFTNYAYLYDDQFVNIVVWDDDSLEFSAGYEIKLDEITNIKMDDDIV